LSYSHHAGVDGEQNLTGRPGGQKRSRNTGPRALPWSGAAC